MPDLVVHTNNRTFLCDVTVVDTMADSNLNCQPAALGPALLAEEAAREKVDKYELVADTSELYICPSLSRQRAD